jgi:hypothetical protein
MYPKNASLFILDKYEKFKKCSDIRAHSGNKTFWPYEAAMKFAKNKGIKTQKEWHELYLAKKLPKSLPADPRAIYKDVGWVSWYKFVGKGSEFFPIETIKKIIKRFNINGSRRQWDIFFKNNKHKKTLWGIPASPQNVYKHSGWISWSDFLGTNSTHYIQTTI